MEKRMTRQMRECWLRKKEGVPLKSCSGYRSIFLPPPGPYPCLLYGRRQPRSENGTTCRRVMFYLTYSSTGIYKQQSLVLSSLAWARQVPQEQVHNVVRRRGQNARRMAEESFPGLLTNCTRSFHDRGSLPITT